MMEQYQSYASTFKNENIILKNAVFQKFMYNVYYYFKKNVGVEFKILGPK